MKTVLKQIARALYQIIVVGIILLPFRVAIIVFGLLYGLMTVVQGKGALKEYYGTMLAGIIIGYQTRAAWVKYGNDAPELEFEEEEESLE